MGQVSFGWTGIYGLSEGICIGRLERRRDEWPDATGREVPLVLFLSFETRTQQRYVSTLFNSIAGALVLQPSFGFLSSMAFHVYTGYEFGRRVMKVPFY